MIVVFSNYRSPVAMCKGSSPDDLDVAGTFSIPNPTHRRFLGDIEAFLEDAPLPGWEDHKATTPTEVAENAWLHVSDSGLLELVALPPQRAYAWLGLVLGPTEDDSYGLTELARLTGISVTKWYQWSLRAGFPANVRGTDTSRRWYRKSIEDWALHSTSAPIQSPSIQKARTKGSIFQ